MSSSKVNTAPIKGLLKPPAKPAPAPIAIKERSDNPESTAGKRSLSALATEAPTCTTGPSRPRGSSARLAAVQRLRRCTVGVRPSMALALVGSSRLSMVWGIPDPAPAFQRPACNHNSKGITSKGAMALARPPGCQARPVKPGRWCSHWACQPSTWLRGRQARPTARPKTASCTSVRRGRSKGLGITVGGYEVLERCGAQAARPNAIAAS